MDTLKYTIGLRKFIKVKEKMEEDVLSNFGISMFHVQYLLVLKDLNNEATLKDLSDILEVNKSNTSRAVLKLLSKGYVKKINSDKKQRGYSIIATAKGIELTEVIITHLDKQFYELLSPLENKEEEAQLKDLMQKLVSKY